jgi:6-phosphogluconolactonase
MNGELRLVEDVPDAFAELLIEEHAARVTPVFSIALSGGSTAGRCYEALATRANGDLWPSLELFWGDERCVPFDDVDSNYRLAADSLGPGFTSVRSVHPMNCSHGAEQYNTLIANSRPIDLVHLGLGPDGHTASLFSESSALAATGSFVVLNDDPTGRNPYRRMTLTFRAIQRASTVIVTVEGSSKREALRRVMDGDLSAPAASIKSRRLIWLVDEAALGSRQPR